MQRSTLLLAIFFQITLSTTCPGQTSPAHTVTLTNPLDAERTDELIVWRRSDLENKLGKISPGKFIRISDDHKMPVAVQFDDLDGDGVWEEAVFLHSFRPLEKWRIQVAVSDRKAAIKLVVRAHTRMRAKMEDDQYGPNLDSATMPFRNPPTDFSKHHFPPWLTEGPGWENDKVAYRLYFDTRNNKDIYGKTTAAMVMDTVGANPKKSYHELADWGMDVLKVGNSLGAGALALSVPREGAKDSLIRLGGQQIKNETYRKLADGPIRAAFLMSYEWEIDGSPVFITEQISISAGQYFYGSKVDIKDAPAGSRLVTGIANFYSNNPGNFSQGDAQVLYCHGRQSENKDMMGMAILAESKDFSAFGSRPASGSDVTSTYTLSQVIKKDQPLYFRFYTGWERTDPGFKSEEFFRNFLKKEADKFNHPLLLKW